MLRLRDEAVVGEVTFDVSLGLWAEEMQFDTGACADISDGDILGTILARLVAAFQFALEERIENGLRSGVGQGRRGLGLRLERAKTTPIPTCDGITVIDGGAVRSIFVPLVGPVLLRIQRNRLFWLIALSPVS